MAVLLSPPPPASRSHRAQPARLRRAPRASRVAFGSSERGCALPPHKPSQTLSPVITVAIPAPGMAVLLFPPPPASRSHRAQPARLRRAPRASHVAFGSAERGCALPPAQTIPNPPQKSPRTNLPKPSPKIPPHKPAKPPPKPSPSPQKNSKKQMPQAGTSVLFTYYIDGGSSRPLFRKTTTE